MIKNRPIYVSVCTDAGPAVGYGHIRRTLAVASKLRESVNMQVRYLMPLESDTTLLDKAGYPVIHRIQNSVGGITTAITPEDGPLILDSYEFSKEDLEYLHHAGFCTILFDDGKRLNFYAANAVIDYSPEASQWDYQGLATTKFCLGPHYFPIRSEFLNQQIHQKQRFPVQTILISFGGSDPEDQTTRLVRLFSQHSQPWRVTTVLGPGYEGQVKKFVFPGDSIHVKYNIPNVAKVFGEADLAISGAGGTALELGYLGVPTLLMALSKEQKFIASAMEKAGAAINLGWYEHIKDDEIWDAITRNAANAGQLQKMSIAGQHVVDGRGVERLVSLVKDVWQQHYGEISNL